MKQLVFLLGVLGLSSAHSTEWVRGDSPTPTLIWRCGFYPDFNIRCVTITAPDPEADPVVQAGYRPPDRLPAGVADLRTRPGDTRGRVWSIPIWNEPYDWAFAAELAELTMCGSRPQCRVHLTDAPIPENELLHLQRSQLKEFGPYGMVDEALID